MTDSLPVIHHVNTYALLIIYLSYLQFAGKIIHKAFKRRKYLDHDRGVALFSTAFVFVFCAHGHLSSLLPESLQYLRDNLHWVLAVLAILLANSKAASILAGALEKNGEAH